MFDVLLYEWRVKLLAHVGLMKYSEYYKFSGFTACNPADDQ